MKIRVSYLLLMVFLLAVTGFSQKGFTIKDKAENKFENDKKVGRWIEYRDTVWKQTDYYGATYYHLVVYEKGIPVGIGRDYFIKNDQLQNEYTYVNGVKNGPSKWFYETGELSCEANYLNDKREGKVSWYYMNGKVKQEATLVNGLFHGKCTWYYDNGAMETQVNYSDDLKDGKQEWFFKSGSLSSEVNYVKDKKEGIQKWYEEKTSKLISEGVYVNGELNGIYKTYYTGGGLQSEVNCISGKSEGLYKMYYESGKIKQEINYKNDKWDGAFLTYWENGQIKRSDKYENGTFIKGNTFDEQGKEVDYYKYEIMAEYFGGVAELGKYIQNEVKYPVKARNNGIYGRVIVKFVVNTDGSISEVEVVKSVSKELDEEAIRVVSKMPNWKPGMRDGEKVRVFYNLPIKFKL